MLTAHKRWSAVLSLAFLTLFFLTSGCVSTEKGSNGSEKIHNNALTLKGRVQKISLGEGIIVVAPPKGDHVTLKITEKTPVTGGSMREVEKNRPVRVMYTVEGKLNIVVSIELLPQGSCG
jgi:hypothetical protein